MWEMNGQQRVPEHLINANFEQEGNVARIVADLTGNTLVEFPRYSTVDRLLTSNGLAMAWLEVKTRTTPMNHYPTYRLSREKLRDLRSLEYDTKIPALIAVMWSCGAIGVIKASNNEWNHGTYHEDAPLHAFTPLAHSVTPLNEVAV